MPKFHTELCPIPPLRSFFCKVSVLPLHFTWLDFLVNNIKNKDKLNNLIGLLCPIPPLRSFFYLHTTFFKTWLVSFMHNSLVSCEVMFGSKLMAALSARMF